MPRPKARFFLTVALSVAIVVGAAALLLDVLQQRALESSLANRMTTLQDFAQACREHAKKDFRRSGEDDPYRAIPHEQMRVELVVADIFQNVNDTEAMCVYKLATPGSSHPDRKADDFESGIVARFNESPGLTELSGSRTVEGRDLRYLAVPFVVERSCLACHGESNAPRSSPAASGDPSHEHDWHEGKAVAATLLYVPTEDLRAQYATIRRTLWGVLSALALALVALSYSVFAKLVDRTADLAKARDTAEAFAREQALINVLLRIATEADCLEETLQRSLDEIVLTGWLSPEGRGAVFLFDNDPNELVLSAHRNMAPEMVQVCVRVPLGRCLCGRAAATDAIVFADRVDKRHEIRYEGIVPHGHYAVPIRFGGKVLGVLTLHVPEGHRRDSREEDFLQVLSRTLGGIIEHKRSEASLRRKEEELRHSQRMEAMGLLAGGIAHEFNNLLQAIGGYTRCAMEGISPAERRHADLQTVLAAADRASMLTRQLLGFSRRRILQPENLDPNKAVADLVKMVRPVIGEHITLDVVPGADVGTVYADAGELQQVLINLCLNARDAMPSGGKLLVRTESVVLRNPSWDYKFRTAPGRYLVFSVTDTGCGMSADVRQRIFEPFFTTKGVGKGTGLGLAMVYGIVEQHKGAVHVYSEPGRGTTFKVYLPSGTEVREVEHAAETATACCGTETILLAEDDPAVRNLAVRYLSEAGYTVLAAPDGEEALRLFEENRPAIALVILDAIMPNLTGREVYRRLRVLHPDIKVLFCTGYDPETAQSNFIAEEHLRLIEKPFDADMLLGTVREILDETEVRYELVAETTA